MVLCKKFSLYFFRKGKHLIAAERVVSDTPMMQEGEEKNERN